MRIILMFLPVLIPLLIYFIFYSRKAQEAAKLRKPKPKFINDEFFKFMIASFLIGLVIFFFIFLDFSQRKKSEDYKPARMENGIFKRGK